MKLRRYTLILASGFLCALKLAGYGIPLWLCLLPALAVPVAMAAVLAGGIALCGVICIAYIVAVVHELIVGGAE